MRNNNSGKMCFIITPIGDEGSDIRKRAMEVLNKSIKPSLKLYGLNENDIIHAGEICQIGSIKKQIIECIDEADYIIVNLTGLNPNVMYELGVAQAKGKRTLLICDENTELPFDINDYRTIFFKECECGYIKLKDELTKYLNEGEFNFGFNISGLDSSSREFLIKYNDEKVLKDIIKNVSDDTEVEIELVKNKCNMDRIKVKTEKKEKFDEVFSFLNSYKKIGIEIMA